MKNRNFVSINKWAVYKDKIGSSYRLFDYSPRTIIENQTVVAVELTLGTKNRESFPWVCLALELESFNIEPEEFSSLKITYRSKNGLPILLNILETGHSEYGDIFQINLSPSTNWKTVIIKSENFIKPEKSQREQLSTRIDSINFTFDFNTNNSDILEILDLSIGNIQVPYGNDDIETYSEQSDKETFLDTGKQFKNYFCILPFTLLRVDHEGVAPCCWLDWREKPVGIGRRILKKIWFGKAFQNIRYTIKDDSYNFCNTDECTNLPITCEFFKSRNYLIKNDLEILDYIEGRKTVWERLPDRIDFAFDAECNLRCKSCSIDSLQKYSKDIKKKILFEIEEIGGNIKTIYIAAMGDPFATSSYRNWLINFPANKFPKLEKVIFQTNAIFWKKDLWMKIEKSIGQYCIDAFISIDGGTAATYEKNRYGSSFITLMENMDYISLLRKEKRISRLNIDCIIQKNNFTEIPLLIKIAREFCADEITFTKISNWGTYSEKAFKEINISDPDNYAYKRLSSIIEKAKKEIPTGLKVFFRC